MPASLKEMINAAHLPAKPHALDEIKNPDARVLLLTADHYGWSLSSPDGEIVFQAAGLAGRAACLRYARDHGVLALISR
jgi:hypothetical protein